LGLAEELEVGGGDVLHVVREVVGMGGGGGGSCG